MNRTIIIGVGGAGCAIAEQLGRSLGYDVLVVNSADNRLDEKAVQHRLCLNVDSRSDRLPTVVTAEAAAGEAADEFRKIITGNHWEWCDASLGGDRAGLWCARHDRRDTPVFLRGTTTDGCRSSPSQAKDASRRNDPA